MATVSQLGSAESMLDHLKQFPKLVISEGLANSVLDGMSDVHELIASWSDSVSLTHASALTVLARETRKRLTVQVAAEIIHLAQEKAVAGNSTLTVPVLCLPSGKHIGQDIRSEIEAGVITLLSDAGFQPGYNRTPGGGYFVRFDPFNWSIPDYPHCQDGERVVQLKWEH